MPESNATQARENKNVALVDIDGVLTQDGELNETMVAYLQRFDRIILYTQRCKSVQQQGLLHYINTPNAVVSTPNIVTKLEERLNKTITVSTSLDPIFQNNYYDAALKDYETRILTDMKSRAYDKSEVQRSYRNEVNDELTQIRTKRNLADDAKDIIPKNKIEQYQYLLSTDKTIQNPTYFDDNIANLVEMMEAGPEFAKKELPVPKCQMVIGKNILSEAATKVVIAQYQQFLKSLQFQENNSKKGGPTPLSPDKQFMEMYQSNLEGICFQDKLIQNQHVKSQANNRLSKDNERRMINLQQSINGLKDYETMRQDELNKTNKQYNSVLGNVLKFNNLGATTKINATQKSIKILEFIQTGQYEWDGWKKPEPLTLGELAALSNGRLSTKLSPAALNIIQSYPEPVSPQVTTATSPGRIVWNGLR